MANKDIYNKDVGHINEVTFIKWHYEQVYLSNNTVKTDRETDYKHIHNKATLRHIVTRTNI